MSQARRVVVALITAISLVFAFARAPSERVVRTERVIRVAPPVAPSIVALRVAVEALKARNEHAFDSSLPDFLPPPQPIAIDVAERGALVSIHARATAVDNAPSPSPRARAPPLS